MFELVEFYGDQIAALLDDDGAVWVSVRRISENFGRDYNAQERKLREASWATLAKKAMVGADGAIREHACLRLDCLPGWLFTIKPGNMDPERKAKLSLYQQKAKDVLATHFGITPDGQLAVEQSDERDELLDVAAVPRIERCVETAKSEILDSDERTRELVRDEFQKQNSEFAEMKDEVVVLRQELRESRNRKPIDKDIRSLHAEIVRDLFQGICPCCSEERIIDEETGEPNTRFNADHFRLPSQNKKQFTWGVCRKCNIKLIDGDFHSSKEQKFLVYQEMRIHWEKLHRSPVLSGLEEFVDE